MVPRNRTRRWYCGGLKTNEFEENIQIKKLNWCRIFGPLLYFIGVKR